MASYETKRFSLNQGRKQFYDLGVVSLICIVCFVTLILPYFGHLPCLLTDRDRTAGIDMEMVDLYVFLLGRNLCLVSLV